MIRLLRLARLEWLLLGRDRAARYSAALVLAAGVVAVLHGNAVIERQRRVLADSPARQSDEHARVLTPLPPSTSAGEQLYYLFFHTVREPSPWAAVAIGQRDVQAFNLKVRLHGLQGQLYDADLGNPLLASFGHFDLAFVLVVLVPLVVIGLGFNVRSSEDEGGTWTLLRVQAPAPRLTLAVRYALRALGVWLLLAILLAGAALALRIPFDQQWWSVAALTAVYVLVWTMAVAAVAALRRGSEFSLLALFGVWATWTALGPALIAATASARFQLPEAMELTVLQRQGFHGAWDEPLPEVMEAFYAHYPEWRSTPVPQDTYSNAWYYAMHQRGDDAALAAAERYRTGLQDRDRWIGRASWLFPPAAFQRLLTRIARTDQSSHLAYLDSVAAYHERLKRHFLPVIFSSATVREVDWASAPHHHHRD